MDIISLGVRVPPTASDDTIYLRSCGGMADALDSGSSGCKTIGVQVPSAVLKKGILPTGVCLFSMNALQRGVELRRKGSAGGTPLFNPLRYFFSSPFLS